MLQWTTDTVQITITIKNVEYNIIHIFGQTLYECETTIKVNENKLCIFERKILEKIFGSKNVNFKKKTNEIYIEEDCIIGGMKKVE